MFRDQIKLASMVALTLVILVGALSLNATSVAFAADQSTKPASQVTPSDARLRACNVDGDRDNDDMCLVVGGRYFPGYGLGMGNGMILGSGRYALGNGYLLGNGGGDDLGTGYGLRNRYLTPSFDTDNDVVYPQNLGPYPGSYLWWWR